jgi:hypothetical protein
LRVAREAREARERREAAQVWLAVAAGPMAGNGDGDVDMDGNTAVDEDVAMDGDITMDGAEDDVAHYSGNNGYEYQNRYEDNDEADATTPVGHPSTHTTPEPQPYRPHRSIPLRDPHQTVPSNVLPTAARGNSGSMQSPRLEALSRERERRFGSSAGGMRPCGCFWRPWEEDRWRWEYCEEQRRIRQEEEDEEMGGGGTVSRDGDGDGSEPEPPRGRQRYRY